MFCFEYARSGQQSEGKVAVGKGFFDKMGGLVAATQDIGGFKEWLLNLFFRYVVTR